MCCPQAKLRNSTGRRSPTARCTVDGLPGRPGPSVPQRVASPSRRAAERVPTRSRNTEVASAWGKSAPKSTATPSRTALVSVLRNPVMSVQCLDKRGLALRVYRDSFFHTFSDRIR